MTFHRPYEVALGVSRKKLAMNDVNVFACVKNHKSYVSDVRTSV